MKAIIQHEFGGPEVLNYEDVDDPSLGPEDVLIEVHAVSVNATLDFLAREGKYTRPVTLPHVLGVDPSGVIVAVGEKVTERKVGERVWCQFFVGCGHCDKCDKGLDQICKEGVMMGVGRWGGYAEKVVIPARRTVPVPDGIPFAHATVIARHFPTAMFLLETQAKIKKDEWVFVTGATGGLGNALIQVAKHHGAKVIAGAGSDDRVDIALQRGADAGVNYFEQDIEAEIANITGGAGLNIICENLANPDIFPKLFNSLAKFGRIVSAGAQGPAKVELDMRQLYLKWASILGGPGNAPDGATRAFEWAVEGHIDPGIDRIMPLKDAADAHRLVASRKITGKVVLDPRGD